MSVSPEILTVSFEQEGDFRAIRCAEQWCRLRGISYGSMQKGFPIGLLAGDIVVSKWTSMNPAERKQLDGTITGEMRTGPVVVCIKRDALERAAGAA